MASLNERAMAVTERLEALGLPAPQLNDDAPTSLVTIGEALADIAEEVIELRGRVYGDR